jgi:hypothetical protein
VKKFILVLTLLALLIPSAVHAQEQNPWGEVFDSNGNLRSDLTDLGVTTEHRIGCPLIFRSVSR